MRSLEQKGIARGQWPLMATAVLLTALVLFATQRDTPESIMQEQPFLPAFRANTSALDKVVLWSSRGKLSLEKDANGRWRLPEKDGYPADLRTVVDFILRVRELKVLEKKTARPDLLPQLGLDEQHGTHVILMAGDTMLGDFVTGRASRHGPGGFVRHASDTQAWLVNKALFVSVKPEQWLDRSVLDLEPEWLQAVRLTSRESTETRLLTTNGPQDTSTALPAKALPAWRKKLEQAVHPLLFDDVMKRPDGPLLPVATTEIQTVDGLIYRFDHFRLNQQWWTALQVQVVAASSGNTPSATERRQWIALNTHWRDWLYRLPPSAWQALTLAQVPIATDEAIEAAAPDLP